MRRLERVERDRLLHTLHRERVRVVHALHRAAEHRRMLDRREDHSVAEHVETELRLAGDDVVLVVGGRLLADEAPRSLRLEHQRLCLRHRQLRSRRHQRAVRQTPAARLMHDLVIRRRAFSDRHVPLRRRGTHEHRPRGRAGLPERVVEVANRSRAVGVLIAVSGIADALLDTARGSSRHRARRPPPSAASCGCRCPSRSDA